MMKNSSPPSTSTPAHARRVRVEWGDCDPAGIVYYPRFFEMFHASMEAWFADCLNMPYDNVILGRKIGFPSVHTEADFRKPTRFGETVVIELSVAKVGNSSIHFDYRVFEPPPGNAVRVVGKTICVVMDLDEASDTFRQAIPMPDDLRERIESFRSGG